MNSYIGRALQLTESDLLFDGLRSLRPARTRFVRPAQLLDALDRLQIAQRRFQERFRLRSENAKPQLEEAAERETAGSTRDDGPATYKSNGHTSTAQT
jgi:hypothetical protein